MNSLQKHWMLGLAFLAGITVVVTILALPISSDRQTVVAATPGCPDLDGDSDVDLDDVNIVTSYVPKTVPPAPPQADVFGPGGKPDGQVDVFNDVFYVLSFVPSSGYTCQTVPIACQGAPCAPKPAEININPVQKSPGPPPFGCYSVRDASQVELFQVCDNDSQAGFPQSHLVCDGDGTLLCEDADTTKGLIRVSVDPGDYNVVESKPPPRYLPTNTTKQPCSLIGPSKCELSFANETTLKPWFPWDVSSPNGMPDGIVDLFYDIVEVIEHFQQSKP